MDELSGRIQALPAELYNLVFQYTFTADSSGKVVYVTSQHKPPSLLQVDRTSRATFARSYYGSNTIFAFRPAPEALSDYAQLSLLWVRSLAREHMVLISDIRVMSGYKFVRFSKLNVFYVS